MNTILEQYADKINGTFSFFDRMIIKGHVLQFFSPSGKKYFLSELDFFAHRVNPFLDTIEKVFHTGYHWCVDQCEYATDVMFKGRAALEDIYPSLVGHTFHDFRCTDIFSFLGRKLDAKFQGEAVSDYRKRPEGWRIKFKMKSNSIKMYDKFSCLRIYFSFL